MKEFELEKQYEKLLNIKTTGRDDSKSDSYRYPYEPTPYCVLERLARSGYVGKKSTLLDYGSGKGRVECFMTYQTGCRAIGIEYDERMYNASIKNKENCNRGSKVEFVLEDATKYAVPVEVDRIFFFNPFSETILENVVSKIKQSYSEKEREIYLMFYFPSDEYMSLLMTCDYLEFEDEIECDDLFEDNPDRERIMIFRWV